MNTKINANRFGLNFRGQEDVKYEKSEIIGSFRDRELKKTILYFVIDNDAVKSSNMRDILIDFGKPPVIFMTSEYAKKLLKNNKQLHVQFPLWHELGHIVLGHYNKFNTTKEIREDRLNAIKAGKVCDTEREADLFAAKRIGFGNAVLALRKIQTDRLEFDKANHLETTQQSILAQKEFEYRMNALQDIAFA